ncbi:hypothetical protein [Pseudoduganella violacea]|uniref:Uncharacterized protein n=1 Tax=Pseudoduganella violacea TaxID=1715466 RepID=A0A7W5FVX4_9BURK|nr:hypothetical protein [Pseudoduganella violacea]MBB3120653.1 hypothetical protein [Pseudoduganella violacea]
MFVDAKQRAVVTNIAYDKDNKPLRRYCAEPSPDALSAFAAKAGLDVSVPTKGDIGYSQAFSEGAASIGLRTQSIQLLRDIMFTNCEAFINAGVTEFGLETLQRRFQSTMVAVLAIEQLTGAVKAPAVTISGQAGGTNADVLGDAIKLVEVASASLQAAQSSEDSAAANAKTAKQELEDFKKKNPADTSSDDYIAAKTKADKADATLKTAKELTQTRRTDLAEAKAVRAAAGTTGGSMSNAVFAVEPARAPVDAATAQHISQAVTKIVESTLELGFGREVCTTLFGQMISQSVTERKKELLQNAEALRKSCLHFLDQDARLAEAAVRRAELQIDLAQRSFEMLGRILNMVAMKQVSAADGTTMIAALRESTGAIVKNMEVDDVKAKVFLKLQNFPVLSKFGVPSTAQ